MVSYKRERCKVSDEAQTPSYKKVEQPVNFICDIYQRPIVDSGKYGVIKPRGRTHAGGPICFGIQSSCAHFLSFSLSLFRLVYFFLFVFPRLPALSDLLLFPFSLFSRLLFLTEGCIASVKSWPKPSFLSRSKYCVRVCKCFLCARACVCLRLWICVCALISSATVKKMNPLHYKYNILI